MGNRSWIERAFTAGGLDCLVVAIDMGHRCGYVRVPIGNRFHGINYDAAVPGAVVNLDRPLGESLGGMISLFGGKEEVEKFTTSLDGIIAVHGGLTFSREMKGEDGWKDGWWIGFDCGHAGDARDHSIMSEDHLVFESRFPELNEGTVWTEEMVAAECEKLARQVANERGDYEAAPDAERSEA